MIYSYWSIKIFRKKKNKSIEVVGVDVSCYSIFYCHYGCPEEIKIAKSLDLKKLIDFDLSLLINKGKADIKLEQILG